MFHADLHLHSKFSRATSSDLDLAHLQVWARKKGLRLVGTGDFTHPGWLAELERDLTPDGSGLFSLKDDLAEKLRHHAPKACDGPVSFILQAEISNIYKQGGKVRKVHNVVLMPDFDGVRRFNARLSAIGNLGSDGRPILGLDARDLLEIALECCPEAILIPAHIWTPWFSVLGSKSGFDSVEECYRDLAGHIRAVETGLSSDPPMNWRVSSLDKYFLVSNSDAHSPQKLARETTLFDCEVTWPAIRTALQTGDGLWGTVEFFPEEGKYHLDGHRKCKTRLTPEETARHDGLCPVCGKGVTVGVLNRVAELADRPAGRRGASARQFRSLVGLDQVIAECLGLSGRGAVKVALTYEHLLDTLGPELFILAEAPLEEIERRGNAKLRQAIERVRTGQVWLEAGFDGEFGVVRVFPPAETRPAPARKKPPKPVQKRLL
jgi:DNA helicase-2/ATP-dependent DNA helicase PcrA